MKRTEGLILLFFLSAGTALGQGAAPSLIPLPQSVHWTRDSLPLSRCGTIGVNSRSLRELAGDLQGVFGENRIKSAIRHQTGNSTPPAVELRLGKVEAPFCSGEAYEIDVSGKRIVITANEPHGIFNGIQTLRQLMKGRTALPGCHIKDWPAFSWRGYMVDVGRNYQSVGQLKQQIRVMSRYKLNVFHFHLTENIAWRLQIRQYPQLTAPENMLRNPGQYYTVREMKDLIKYCRDRFITLVPEIDMPGHSDAFTRAFGFNMQSDSGLNIVKKILSEVDSTYDVPYIHIGADEVKFTNRDFIPAVTGIIHRSGKQTVGWAPGGNYDEQTIRQLWQSEGPQEKAQGENTIRYIDSRDLYLNHMDPLSGVASIFERMIGGTSHENASVMGGEICLWNDLRAKDEPDILLMNAAYPDMLAFAERVWRGGGYEGFEANIGPDSSVRAKAFAEFEVRLLDHQRQYFRHLPFPYVKQSDIHWKLFGPFDNRGNTNAEFWPEQTYESSSPLSPAVHAANSLTLRNPGTRISFKDSTAALEATGATIWLRHFFAPMVQGWLPDPEENTTWYAYTRFYSPLDTIRYLWIGFYNPSRSHVVSTPLEGHWDKRGSKIWLNGAVIPPPHWTYPGRDGSLEAPLVDEDYEYRPPVKVQVKKGWNVILVKAPVASFKGKDWQHPVKWMFTVAPVNEENEIDPEINSLNQ